jgi:hypothetical protein
MNKPVTEENVERLSSCGRPRWKTGNDHNNVLKSRGYNLQHNFGHGKKHASEIFFILNLIGFRLHTILDLGTAISGRPGSMWDGGISWSLSQPKKTWNENENC